MFVMLYIELCQTKDHDQFQESYKRYIWFFAYLLFQKRFGVKNNIALLRHFYCSYTFCNTIHLDPLEYFEEHGVTWANLFKMWRTNISKWNSRRQQHKAKAEANVYVVKPCDTLSKIAARL
ncbi:hypothetical protein A7K69_07765 [Parageobacillus thermoglucosidasius]|uniref:Uncharacterized protein n=1 Tax=Parageobacillus thermoglucosidasius TaxID=1426 RepID=A0A1B7KRV3_PARTM|nr:hypothetical protein A7K69_07765 [Parageobacillus thermoglucosidasius]